ncbi:hypothetical protein I3843_03G182400 [Carya illinoinensis]|nr:hypothetical protein I3843_03G182400 [Carya illinoinensis]
MRFKERAKRKKFTTPVPSEHSSSEDVPSLEPMQLGDTSAPPPSPSQSVPVPTEAPTDRFTSIEAEMPIEIPFPRDPSWVNGRLRYLLLFSAIYLLFLRWNPLYNPYKGMGAPTKTAMRNLFVGLTGPKWTAKTHRLPLHNMLPQYRLLAKIVLTNLWPISRHTEISLERAYFMYALATGVY